MAKRIVIVWYSVYIIILVILAVIGCIYKINANNQSTANTTTEDATVIVEIIPPTETIKDLQTTETTKQKESTDTKDTITIETETDKGVDITEAIKPISLGEFKLTGYCACSKCCGKWALNRPIDENGKEIVYGAIGERLTANYSIAVDPTIIPYRSEVIINGHTYKAQDCGGAIKGNRIDVYFENHEDAWDFGVQYAEVFIIPK